MIKPIKDSETRFSFTTGIVLAICTVLFVYGNADLLYRYTQPTEGWLISGTGDVLLIRDLIGINPALQVGDVIVSIEGMPVDYDQFYRSETLKMRWRAGETLAYEVTRGNETLRIPVTLGHWPSGISAYLREVMGPEEILSYLISLLQVFLAAFVLLRRPGSPTAGAFFMVMFASTWSDFSAVVPFGYAAWISPFAGLPPSTFDVLLYGSIFPASLIWFAMTFPRPKQSYRRFPWIPLTAGIPGIAFQFLASFGNFSWFWFVFSLFLSVGMLIHSAFTMRDRASKAQIRWGIGGFVISYGPASVVILLSTLGIINLSEGGPGLDLLFPVLSLVMVSMLAVGILRYRLFDIDLIIRRTLQYTVLTGLLALLYFGGVTILQALFDALTQEGSSPLVTVITTLMIAALFNPLRNRVQAFIDQRFYRTKYDAEKALADFAVAARDEVDLGVISARLLSIVAETVHPEEVNLQLKPPETR